jgi:hypothetical protein
MMRRFLSIGFAALFATVMVGGGFGMAEQSVLASPVTLPLTPDPSLCPVAMAQSQEVIDARFGTPIASPSGPADAGATPTTFTPPTGKDADQATADAVTQTLIGYLACFNAGNKLAALSLTSNHYLKQLQSQTQVNPDDISYLSGTPQALPKDEFTSLTSIDQVTVLEDGRVSAVVKSDLPLSPVTAQTYWIAFVKQGNAWLIDEVQPLDYGTPAAK